MKSQLFNISDLSGEDAEMVRIFRLAYRLIKHVIKEYRPNELYAAQWIDFFMRQTMETTVKSEILAEATLTELIDNNREVLERKISKSTINNFVTLLTANAH